MSLKSFEICHGVTTSSGMSRGGEYWRVRAKAIQSFLPVVSSQQLGQTHLDIDGSPLEIDPDFVAPSITNGASVRPNKIHSNRFWALVMHTIGCHGHCRVTVKSVEYVHVLLACEIMFISLNSRRRWERDMLKVWK